MNILDKLNELNMQDKLDYNDYSILFDLVDELKTENNELKADKETLQAFVNTFGACAKEIGRDRLEKICEAVKYIGQTGYAVNYDARDNLVVEQVNILKLEISKSNILLVDIWLVEGREKYYSLKDINNRLFFGENAKQLAEQKYNELTAQNGEL